MLRTRIRRPPWHIQPVFEFLLPASAPGADEGKKNNFLIFYNIVQLWGFLRAAGSGEATAATKDKKEKENISLFPRPTYHDAGLQNGWTKNGWSQSVLDFVGHPLTRVEARNDYRDQGT